MNQTQLTTLKAALLAETDPSIVAARATATRDDRVIVAFYNAAASPAVAAWSVAAPIDSIDDAPDYSAFDTIVAGKRDSWGFFLARPRNFARNKIRKWVTDVWGTGANARAILTAGTESAKRIEVVIGGTNKTTDTITALDRDYIGLVTLDDMTALWKL